MKKYKNRIGYKYLIFSVLWLTFEAGLNRFFIWNPPGLVNN